MRHAIRESHDHIGVEVDDILMPGWLRFIDPIHPGNMMVVKGEVGMIMPALDLKLSVFFSVAEMSMADVDSVAAPWRGIRFIFLINITYVPIVSTFARTFQGAGTGDPMRGRLGARNGLCPYGTWLTARSALALSRPLLDGPRRMPAIRARPLFT